MTIPGKLGTRPNTDPRNGRYPYSAVVGEIRTKDWARHVPVWDQGAIGSCAGQAAAGCIGTTQLWEKQTPAVQEALSAIYAEGVYPDATAIDPFDGTYPPDDTGTDTRSVAQVLLNRGLITEYRWTNQLDAILTAASRGPVILGIAWPESFDWPDSAGLVTFDPTNYIIRGGHAVVIDAIDTTNRTLRCTNSWSALWGAAGRFYIHWDTLRNLLDLEWGDVCVPIWRVTQPPAPVPWWRKVLDWLF